MKSRPAASASLASARQSSQLADQRSGTLVAERPDEQLAPNRPILSALSLYMAMRAGMDTAGASTVSSSRAKALRVLHHIPAAATIGGALKPGLRSVRPVACGGGESMLARAINRAVTSWEETMPAAVERSTMRKVYWRLLPISILTYFLCYLDRINVGFAALTMNKDLGLDAAVYGMAAGAFFWGYFLFEVPSNIILEKVGARLWIARIMVTWGLMSGATAFCVGPYSFMTVRFLLGLAEAGLFPGMILFFTYWFPEWHRGRIMAGFTVALPLAGAGGAALATAVVP